MLYPSELQPLESDFNTPSASPASPWAPHSPDTDIWGSRKDE